MNPRSMQPLLSVTFDTSDGSFPMSESIILKNTDLKRFLDALEEAYPTKPRLERMLKIGLDMQCPLGTSLTDIVFAVYIDCEAQRRVIDLIRAAYEGNRRNPVLREFHNRFEKGEVGDEVQSKRPVYELITPQHFDLESIMRKCSVEISRNIHAKGVIGLFLPTDTDSGLRLNDVVSTICRRMESEYGSHRVFAKKPLVLNDTTNGLTDLVREIRESYVRHLKKRHVMFGVVVYPRSKVLEMWQHLDRLNANNGSTHRLIVLIATPHNDENTGSLVKLPLLSFERGDLDRWVLTIFEQQLGWSADSCNVLLDHMTENCVYADASPSESYPVSLVYDYIDDTIERLREAPHERDFVRLLREERVS